MRPRLPPPRKRSRRGLARGQGQDPRLFRFVHYFQRIDTGIVLRWNHRNNEFPLAGFQAMERPRKRPVGPSGFLIEVEFAPQGDAVAQNVKYTAPGSTTRGLARSEPGLGEV